MSMYVWWPPDVNAGEKMSPEQIWTWNSVHYNTWWASNHHHINGDVWIFKAWEIHTNWVRDVVEQDIEDADTGVTAYSHDRIWLNDYKAEWPRLLNTESFLRVVDLDEPWITKDRIWGALELIVNWDPRDEISKTSLHNWGRYIIDWSRLQWYGIKIRHDVDFLVKVFLFELDKLGSSQVKGDFEMKWERVKYRLIRESQGEKEMKRLVFY